MKIKLVKKLKVLLITVPAVIILDQITKKAILDRFTLHEMLPMIQGYFDLTYIRNTGAAFGMLATADPSLRIPFFMLVPLIALGVIGYLFKNLPKNSVLMALALSLIVSGAIGNLIDRIRYGYVVDFLYFSWKHEYFFPAFNVADSAITIGVGLLLLDMGGGGNRASTSV